ncbi:Phosphate transport system permease protein PstA [Thiorhodovibrio winogradskyi]|uniref:Phosphate transport system permease protein PstA n=1 Tax=Thiorhodovibrio winogradskyi TaxID=77007 RepID=A0ABZ0SBA2_9GAMM|nr:phosphate ABC transporter permease PstA [Thiorhodovibrio winogradskyi]
MAMMGKDSDVGRGTRGECMLSGAGLEPGPEQARPASRAIARTGRVVRQDTADLTAIGEPFLWGLGGALAMGILLIASFLFLIFYNGAVTFWPQPIAVVSLTDGSQLAGEPTRDAVYSPQAGVLKGLPEAVRTGIEENGGLAHRVLYRIGNYDLYHEDFRWVSDFEIDSISYPKSMYLFERQEWGRFVGEIAALNLDGEVIAGETLSFDQAEKAQRLARERFAEIRHIERHAIGKINHQMESERLRLRRVELSAGRDSADYARVAAEVEVKLAELQLAYQALADRAREIRERDLRDTLTLREIGGREKTLALSQIVRFYPANALDLGDKLDIYLSRWGEFLTAEPREANTEGGILPAIFGTVAMTLLMVVFTAPLGVITALYLREYAKQGRLVSMVRISVNNLAGVPSIVYGVFGLGFFAYTMGVSIDQLFFPERLPNPTFGTGGILWASLTLALLTVPVVIVASEEALAAVPRSMREGSLACGASNWQTIWYVVLPRALPGVITGLILAMARGAGEVAPLMLVGVVKLAPELPIDGVFPYIHLERSFMHLGFHIFDVGFQSRNSEAGKPMVFVTTMLLLFLIVAMNAGAIYLRSRLRRKFADGGL